ncbi:PAS domain-containing protein [Sphingomonas sp. IBVSS2]|uniref:PAS domain-containing protein n=1 Tax=Sphingomonas sp. IBVSS2 TaxID=1985172 RepID=UPI00211A53BB|nr:PAS domain-containing protein [Sphingomonas sp. IBVSS2]
MHGPVTITYHGRPRYVLLAAESWDAEHGIAERDGTHRELEYQFLVEHMDGGLLVIDPELKITDASSAAALILGRTPPALIGSPITDALPASTHATMLSSLRHVLRSGEQSQFDLALDEDSGTRLRIRAFPWVEGVALLVRVSYEGDEEARLAEQTALEKARAAHGRIEVIRLTVRGTVTMVEAEFARMVGLARERILGLRFVDLLAVRDRTVARDAIERVLSGRSEAEAFDARLLCGGAEEIGARVSIAPLASGYAVGGAIVIVTLDPNTETVQ